MRQVAFALVLVVAVGACGVCQDARAQGAQGDGAKKVRVGTFDSRAIAVAYASSGKFSQMAGRLKADLREAERTGDQQKAKKLWKEGEALQERLHKQGFSTASVANILAQIKEQIPDIARETGVDVIVSKWDLAYQGPSAECVDITESLIKPFHPNEKTLKSIRTLQSQSPIPPEELKTHQCQ